MGVLIVGIGNPLRSDDGVGPAVVERLVGDARSAGMNILACHQLTPDLAADVASASSVLFVDAEDPGSRRPRAGNVARGRVAVHAIPRIDRSSDAIGTWSHHLDPAGLIGLALALYGVAPRASLVTVAGESFDAGEHLSRSVAAALPEVVETCFALAGRPADA